MITFQVLVSARAVSWLDKYNRKLFECFNKKVKPFGAKLAHTARSYPGFHSMKPARSIATPLGGMLVHHKLPPAFCQVALTILRYPFILQLGLAQEQSLLLQQGLSKTALLSGNNENPDYLGFPGHENQALVTYPHTRSTNTVTNDMKSSFLDFRVAEKGSLGTTQ